MSHPKVHGTPTTTEQNPSALEPNKNNPKIWFKYGGRQGRKYADASHIPNLEPHTTNQPQKKRREQQLRMRGMKPKITVKRNK